MLKRSTLDKYSISEEYINLSEAIEKKSVADINKPFHIFICHTSKDKDEIRKLKAYFKNVEKKDAYVDWIDDPELDRSNINEKTATRLQLRMQHSDKLYFVISKNSADSKWMPWELGYFNGRKGIQNIVIYPIYDVKEEEIFDFVGQEYLKIYKLYKHSEICLKTMKLKYLLDKIQ